MASNNNPSTYEFITTDANNAYATETRYLAFRGGNVGIGSTAPAVLLNIASGNSVPTFRVTQNAGVGNGWGNGPLSAIEFWQSDEGSNDGDGKVATKLQQTVYDINGNTRFDVYTNIANGDNMPVTPAMSIKEGNVGIGTPPP